MTKPDEFCNEMYWRECKPLPSPCPKCSGAGEYFVRLPDRVGSPQKRECDCVKPKPDERLLTLLEVKDIALLYCSPETRPTDISIDEYVFQALEAQRDLTAGIKEAECQKRVDRMFARTLDIDTQTLQKVYAAHEKEIEAVGTHILKIIDREEHINSDTIRELRLFGQSLKAKYQKPPK